MMRLHAFGVLMLAIILFAVARAPERHLNVEVCAPTPIQQIQPLSPC